MTTPGPESKIIGKHELHFIPPDRMYFIIRGVFDETDAIPYLDFIYSCGDKCRGLLYCAYDVSDLERTTSGGRARVVHVERPYPYAALAVIRANFSTRALAGMILTAGKRLVPKHFGFPHKFVDSLDEADAWFDDLKGKP